MPQKDSLSDFLNRWHQAAATADEEAFFGAMTGDAIYIGTDPGEHWKRDELKSWAKSAFERDTAWAFEPYDRHIFYSENGQYAWFDEMLKTWMGDCRGSGVCEWIDGKWKIRHYHLAVTVYNDDMDQFREFAPGMSN